jgi:hypothetical protein
VAQNILRTLIAWLEVFRPGLTTPGFANLLVVFAGWVRTSGVHAITEALVVTGVAGRRHHEAYHRFFSRGTWSTDELGRLLFTWLLRLIPDGAPLQLVLDDTIAPRKGPHVFGICSHRDPVRSTRRHMIFVFGHCWVVVAVLIRVPFSRRPWALPLLLRLYCTEKESLRAGVPHRKKTELARDMLDVLVGWTPNRRIELAADNAYCCHTVMHGLSPSVVLFGAMRPDADLYALPPAHQRKGRRRVRGELLPKPQALAVDERTPWQRITVTLYGKRQTIHYKLMCALWYRACGTRLLKIVIVRVDTGAIPWRVFFSTDPTVSVRALLETYAGRWNIEVCFRELKQLLGFADSSARKRAAVERMAPFVALVYSTLVAWATTISAKSIAATIPVRPWYTHKSGFSFADILRAAQRALASIDVLDPRRDFANLHKISRAHPSASAPPRRRAA